MKLATTVPLLLGMGAPAAPVTLTAPSPVASIPIALPVNDVCVPAALLMLAEPPVIWRPSFAPDPLTTTPAPMVRSPFVSRMPSPFVFWMVTFEMLEVKVAVPGAT